MKTLANEVRAITKLCQPEGCLNIVSVLRYGKVKDSSFYLIDMELCEGNLYDLINCSRPSPLGAQFIWGIMVQISNGLLFIHNQGEVHRDLKPQNSIFQGYWQVSLIVSPLHSNTEGKTLEDRRLWANK
jgi:serine/threonine protein kinase